MLLALVVAVLLLCASLSCNVIMVKKTLMLSDQREELIDQIEASLDVLDGCYARLAHNAEVPVLSDEPIIREVVYDIKRAKNAVLAIAGKVAVYGDDGTGQQGDEGGVVR